jgi:hypothetical protein
MQASDAALGAAAAAALMHERSMTENRVMSWGGCRLGLRFEHGLQRQLALVGDRREWIKEAAAAADAERRIMWWWTQRSV